MLIEQCTKKEAMVASLGIPSIYWVCIFFSLMRSTTLPETKNASLHLKNKWFHGSIPYWNAREFHLSLQGNLAFHGLFWSSISLQQTTQRLGRCYLDRFSCCSGVSAHVAACYVMNFKHLTLVVFAPFLCGKKHPIWPIFFQMKPPTGIFCWLYLKKWSSNNHRSGKWQCLKGNYFRRDPFFRHFHDDRGKMGEEYPPRN